MPSILAFSLAAVLALAASRLAFGILPPAPQNSPPPPPADSGDGIPIRHLQLDNMEKQMKKLDQDAHTRREEALREQRERNDRLAVGVQKILQLSVELNQSSQQDRQSDWITIARKLESLAHEIRATLANRAVPHVSRPDRNEAVCGRDVLRRQSNRCMELALLLKEQMDQVLNPQNQNTVSAGSLKAQKAHDKARGPAAMAMSTAADIEALTAQLSASAR